MSVLIVKVCVFVDPRVAMFLYAKLVMTHLKDQNKLRSLRDELKPSRFPRDWKEA
jgi:hypothetical protein